MNELDEAPAMVVKDRPADFCVRCNPKDCQILRMVSSRRSVGRAEKLGGMIPVGFSHYIPSLPVHQEACRQIVFYAGCPDVRKTLAHVHICTPTCNYFCLQHRAAAMNGRVRPRLLQAYRPIPSNRLKPRLAAIQMRG